MANASPRLEALRRALAGRRDLARSLVPASQLERLSHRRPEGLSLPAGRVVALLGPGRLTLAAWFALSVQRRGELAVWVAQGPGLAYPLDLQALGLDLAALPVVRIQEPDGALKAAERLASSGAFGLVILDLDQKPQRSFRRLVQAASRSGAATLLLGPEAMASSPGLGRLRIRRRRASADRFTCVAEGLGHGLELACEPPPELMVRP